MIFPNISWQRVAEVPGRRYMAEKADGSNGTHVPFVTSDNSRRDNETCWLHDIRSRTNPLDSVISSLKTKGFFCMMKYFLSNLWTVGKSGVWQYIAIMYHLIYRHNVSLNISPKMRHNISLKMRHNKATILGDCNVKVWMWY